MVPPMTEAEELTLLRGKMSDIEYALRCCEKGQDFKITYGAVGRFYSPEDIVKALHNILNRVDKRVGMEMAFERASEGLKTMVSWRDFQRTGPEFDAQAKVADMIISARPKRKIEL